IWHVGCYGADTAVAGLVEGLVLWCRGVAQRGPRRRRRMEKRRITEEELNNFLHNTGDARHRRVARMVEEVQSVMLELTVQISSWDSRFQSISNSGIHSDHLKEQPDLLAHWMALLRGRRSLHPCIQVMAPSQLLVTVPLRGLSGFRHRRSRRWRRYYTPSGVRLLTPGHGAGEAPPMAGSGAVPEEHPPVA
ncbi:unnamed protein product, partial [Staurois parvus]